MEELYELRLPSDDVDNCRFERWYPTFQMKNYEETGTAARKKWTMASTIIDLGDDFVEYLKSDGVVLPQVPEGMSLRKNDPRASEGVSENDYEAFGDVDWDESDEESEGSHPFAKVSFPKVEQAINDALEEHGNQVFCKMNWTSPQDASWVCGSLKCCSPGDIYLLLKSSDFVNHDLEHAYKRCYDKESDVLTNPKLVLRSWANLNPAMEFRCFVYDKKLVAVVQRFPQTFYEYLALDKMGAQIFDDICVFYDAARISERLPNKHFSFDVYVDKKCRVWLLDFGPLAEINLRGTGLDFEGSSCSTDLASVPPHELLSWEDLYTLVNSEADLPDFRIVESQKQATKSGDVKGSHRVPYECVTGDLTPEIVNLAKAQLDKMNSL